MDGPDAKRFLTFFAIQSCHMLIALFSLQCVFSLVALHCYRPSRFISGKQIAKLRLHVWDWWQLSTGPVSILYFPTCQLRIGRFYQSRLLLFLVLLFAKLLANPLHQLRIAVSTARLQSKDETSWFP